MAIPHEHVNLIFCLKHLSVLERDAHARPHPVARLKSSPIVLHYFVGKNEKREVAGSIDFRKLVLVQCCSKDYPILYQAIRFVREALSY